MRELVLYLAKYLVDVPDQVSVEAVEDAGVTKMSLRVADEDKGKIIGKQGKVIKALRAIVAVAAVKSKGKVLLDLE